MKTAIICVVLLLAGCAADTCNEDCRKTLAEQPPPMQDGRNLSSGDFATSAVVGYASGSWAIGTVVGGDPIGAAVGAAMSDDDDD
jgi:hypothetical protein